MAITLVGTAQSGFAANGDDVTLTFDVAPQEDDVVVVFGATGDTGSTLTAPTGYTEIWTETSSSVLSGAWYKVQGSTPDSDVTMPGSNELTDATAAGCYVLRGVDTSTPMDATRTVATDTSGPPDCPSITTVTDGAWVFAAAYSDSTDNDVTGPSGYSTPIVAGGADTNDATIAAAYREVATAGAEDPGAWSFFGVTARYYGLTVAVRPSTGEPEPDPDPEPSKKKGRSSKKRGVERLRIILRDGEQLKIK